MQLVFSFANLKLSPYSSQTETNTMPDPISFQSDEEQLRKYRELAKTLRQWSSEPDDSDWSVIEAEIKSAGMKCRDDVPVLVKESVAHAPHS